MDGKNFGAKLKIREGPAGSGLNQRGFAIMIYQ